MLTSLTNYLENGNMAQENLFLLGKCYYYASYAYNGKTVSRMNSIDQKGCFKREEYNDDGILTFKGECLDPKQKNPGAQFNQNGICISQRSFENNEWNGKGTRYPHQHQLFPLTINHYRYSPSGLKIYEGHYSKGRRDGLGVAYDANGVKEYEGWFKLDKRTGLGTAFDENGLIFYKGKWINDVRQGQGVSYMESGSKEYEGYWVKDKVSLFQ